MAPKRKHALIASEVPRVEDVLEVELEEGEGGGGGGGSAGAVPVTEDLTGEDAPEMSEGMVEFAEETRRKLAKARAFSLFDAQAKKPSSCDKKVLRALVDQHALLLGDPTINPLRVIEALKTRELIAETVLAIHLGALDPVACREAAKLVLPEARSLVFFWDWATTARGFTSEATARELEAVSRSVEAVMHGGARPKPDQILFLSIVDDAMAGIYSQRHEDLESKVPLAVRAFLTPRAVRAVRTTADVPWFVTLGPAAALRTDLVALLEEGGQGGVFSLTLHLSLYTSRSWADQHWNAIDTKAISELESSNGNQGLKHLTLHMETENFLQVSNVLATCVEWLQVRARNLANLCVHTKSRKFVTEKRMKDAMQGLKHLTEIIVQDRTGPKIFRREDV